MATRCTDLAYRIPEQITDTNQRRLACTDSAYRIPEQIADTNQRRLAHTDPAYRIPEQINDTNRRRLAREQMFFYEMATKFDTSSCTYLYNQPCGLWNEECCHGCGYIHLSGSTSSTKDKCCANGALSSVSVVSRS